MSTGNFCFANRCIVVTNDDLENGNMPSHEKYLTESLRSYPSYLLDDFDRDFKYWRIVITSGYYEAACIDYIENDYSLRDDYATDNYESVKELLDDLVRFEGLSRPYLNKVFKGLRSYGGELWRFLDEGLEQVDGKLREIERSKVNEALDKLKEEYGYEEYRVSTMFSNGETWYSKI